MDINSSKLISIIAPVYNEGEGLYEFQTRIDTVIKSLDNYNWEIIYINDGSRDNSLCILKEISKNKANITILDLSRNFGKEIALTAGIDASEGDAIIVIDTDLQDPPELFADFIQEWENGYDVVYATRTQRDGESWLKKWTAEKFYKVLEKTSSVPIPRDTGDFRLMSRTAVNALLQLREHHRFMKGLFSWVGFEQKSIPYRREPRHAGDTKFNYWKLWNFALEGITSFTSLPLRAATYIGMIISSLAFIYGFIILTKTIIWGDPVQGFPSLMLAILLLGGINLMFLGIIGEYIGRIFNEVKQRPLYFVKKTIKSPQSHEKTNQKSRQQ